MVQDNIDWKRNQFIELLLEGIEIVNENGEKLDAYGEAATIEISDVMSGLNNAIALDGLNVFPNPVSNGQLFINIDDQYQNVQLSLVNLAGQVVLSQNSVTSGVHQLNLESIESGYYIVVFETSQGKHNAPVVIR